MKKVVSRPGNLAKDRDQILALLLRYRETAGIRVYPTACEYSFCRAEWRQNVERIGWINYIGVRSENRQKGLGHAILLATLHQLYEMGAETAMLVTVSTNHPAIKLYERAGFTPMNVLEPSSYEMKVQPT